MVTKVSVSGGLVGRATGSLGIGPADGECACVAKHIEPLEEAVGAAAGGEAADHPGGLGGGGGGGGVAASAAGGTAAAVESEATVAIQEESTSAPGSGGTSARGGDYSIQKESSPLKGKDQGQSKAAGGTTGGGGGGGPLGGSGQAAPGVGSPTLRTERGGGGAAHPVVGQSSVMDYNIQKESTLDHAQSSGGLAEALLEAGRVRGPQAEAQARRLSGKMAQLQTRAICAGQRGEEVDDQWWSEMAHVREEFYQMMKIGIGEWAA